MPAAARRGEAADHAPEARLGATVPDRADGLAGGPDVWIAAEGAALRSRPDATFEAIASPPPGDAAAGARRCMVATPGQEPREGWVDGAALGEAPAR